MDIDERRLPIEDRARLLSRRGDAVALRRIAWQMIETGAAAVVEFDGERLPLRHRSKPDCLDRPAAAPRVLVAPVRVALLWDHRRARLFACDCAERVLHLFEHDYPGDLRPRRAIEVARAYADGCVTKEEMDAARAAARAAAWSAAGAAARDAAGAAAGDAARAAARDAAGAAAGAAAWSAANYAARAAARAAAGAAAGAAAWAAEGEWQAHRLLAYLLGVEGGDDGH